MKTKLILFLLGVLLSTLLNSCSCYPCMFYSVGGGTFDTITSLLFDNKGAFMVTENLSVKKTRRGSSPQKTKRILGKGGTFQFMICGEEEMMNAFCPRLEIYDDAGILLATTKGSNIRKLSDGYDCIEIYFRAERTSIHEIVVSFDYENVKPIQEPKSGCLLHVIRLIYTYTKH